MDKTTNSDQSTETEDETENPQPETGTTTTTGTDETSGTTTTPSQTQPSLDELQAQIKRLDQALKKANNDAKSHRLENADLKKFKEQTEAEKLSEQEKQTLARQNLEKQLAEQQAKLTEQERLTQERIIGYEVRLQAASLGVKPNLLDKVTRLLDWAEIEYNDDGSPKNVKDLLGTLLKEMPELVMQQEKKAPSTSGGATNPASSSTSKQALSWEMIGQLKPAEYEARRAEIQRFMSDPKNHRTRH